MLKYFFSLFMMVACLATSNAQVDITLQNTNAFDTWSMQIVDSASNSYSTTLIPGGIYFANGPLVFPVTFIATSSAGCSAAGQYVAPPISQSYPVTCGNTTSVSVTSTTSFPPLNGTFIAIAN
ncbi:MAG: hypothetical protein AAGA77_09740 [Bacteroidota bacterium]